MKTAAVGAQTERRASPWPVRVLLGGCTAPAGFIPIFESAFDDQLTVVDLPWKPGVGARRK